MQYLVKGKKRKDGKRAPYRGRFRIDVSTKRISELVRLKKLRRFDFLGRTYDFRCDVAAYAVCGSEARLTNRLTKISPGASKSVRGCRVRRKRTKTVNSWRANV
jgi:hypothetical protein